MFVPIVYTLLLYNCDPITEVSIKIQEAEDTYISQATFLVKELLMEIMTSECLQIRVPDKPGMDPVQYEQVNKLELFPEVETAVEVYREVMEEKDLGRALNPTERISVFLDPRRKILSKDDCIGGGNALQTMVISDIEELEHHFVGNVAQTSRRTPVPAPAPASALASAPAPAPSPAPAPAPAHGLATPAVTLPRVSSVMEQKRLARLAAAGHGGSSHGAQGGGVQPVTHHVALRQELTNYRGQNVEADVCGFSLPGFWLRKSEPTLAQGTGELVAPPDLPHLALVARRFHGVEATSCQAERNFSSLSFLIGTLRASMSPFKVEQMMFLKLNQACLPEIQTYNAVIAAQQERRSQCLQDVQSAQEAPAGETVDVELYKSLYVAVNACLKLKASEMSQFGTKGVECKPDRNRPADLT